MQEGAKVHMMRELGPYDEREYTNPNALRIPPGGVRGLPDLMGPGMMGPVPLAGMDPSMITTPRDNQYNVAQWNKETMLRKGVDPRMFSAYGGTARPTYTQSRKQRMAGGGIASMRDQIKYNVGPGEQLTGKPGGIVEAGVGQYGKLSKLIKKGKSAVKKLIDPAIDMVTNVVKSPVGKAALIAAGGAGLMGAGPLSMLQPVGQAIGKGVTSLVGGGQNLLTKGATAAKNLMGIGSAQQMPGMLGDVGGRPVMALIPVLAASGMVPAIF